MLLTVSKRLEFSASRRLFAPDWSEAENRAAFGPETTARYGTGRNYVAYFVFTGEVDPDERDAGQHQRNQSAGRRSLARALRS